MLIDAYGKNFSRDSHAEKAVPNNTALGRTADEIVEMVSCYASDGLFFYKKGDLVNAAASFAYGYGWLDAGKYLGYIAGERSTLAVIDEKIPETLLDHLTEKTYRYQRMLTGAVNGVFISPDPETAMYKAAVTIRETAVSYLEKGEERLLDDLVNALVLFSYGYGWLDCGVRAGLFLIHGDRHLFTI